MKTVLHAVVAAFSTFSIIPMPEIEWDENSLRGLLAALPLVGAAIGAFLVLYYYIARGLGLSVILSAAVYTVLPIAISGGIHMDGFADTTDARKSYGDPEKKRKILKDPHSGAFAVIGVTCYILLYFGLCCAFVHSLRTILLLSITHVLARTTGALAGTLLPGSTEEGMLSMFRKAASKANVWVLLGWAAACITGAAFLNFIAAPLFLIASAAVFFYVKRTAEKQFGGMSGDLSGWCISLTSIVLLAVIVLSERLVAIWF